jgi:hypothetical protein
MKYAIEMDLGAMKYIRSFIITGSAIKKYWARIHTEAHRISLLLLFFFKISKVGWNELQILRIYNLVSLWREC